MRLAMLCSSVLVLLTAFGSVSTAAPQPPPLEYQAQVVETFSNSLGEEVLYRRGWYGGGGRGFGYDKIIGKHGITNNAVVRAVVRAPQLAYQDGSYWIHEKQAVHIGFLTESQTLTVRVVINYAGWQGPGQHGVVTAYCLDYIVCPEWVNRAFAVD